jgi:heme A synthase
MNKRQTKKRVQSKRTLPRPLMIALAVAIVGVLGMLIVDYGLWNRPKVQTAEIVHYTTTDAAARAVGAMVTPSAPKLDPEPVPPGPKPAQPANPTPP